MNPLIQISTDNERNNFILTGDTKEILSNPRLGISLKRLEYVLDDKRILIPFHINNKIEILQELQYLMEKYSFGSTLSREAQEDVSTYNREQQTFQLFSDKAKSIRNNMFKENPELISYFDDFQKVLQQKLVRRLYPLQLLSAFHMAFSQNSCNFAVPGAGKTSIVYSAYSYLKNLPDGDPKHVDKILVIGPLSSFAPWENEYRECFGRLVNSQRLSGDSKMSKDHKERHLFSSNPAELTLIFHGGVNSLKSEIISFLKKYKTMVVVDEAHRIKNPEGVWGKSIADIAKEAQSRIVLTGTPVPNGYEDLFNLFQFLYPFQYKSILGFHYGNLQDMTKNSEPDSERVERFVDNISPYFIRIKKSDLKLPPTSDHLVTINMDPNQREIYDFIENKYIKSFRKNSSASVRDVLNKAKLIRLRQAAINPSLLLKPIVETLCIDDYESRTSLGENIPDEFQDDSLILSKIRSYSEKQIPKKFIEIKNIIDSKIFPTQGKVIVWTIFIQNAKQLQKYLNNNSIRSELLIGEVAQSDRESIIEKFNNPENFEFQVVIANPFSVSESISLHKGCHSAIYMERDYNCSNFLQSKDRIHRYGLLPGQKTDYYYLLSKDSIDEVINERLDIKIKRMERIIDEEIPLFTRIDNSDETDLITELMKNYAKRT